MLLLSVIPVAEMNEGRNIWHLLIGVTIAACICLPRPILMRTYWRERYPFVLDDELNNMLLGRLIGLACGAMAGMFVLAKIA